MVIQALRYHFLSRPEIRILIILVNVFAIFSAALYYFHKVSALAFLVSSLLWVVLMVSLWFILPNAVYKRAATFQDAFTINFGQYGVRIENERGHTDWSWSKFSTYIESPHFIHLYFDSRSFFLVPKSAVKNLQELRDILRREIPKTK